MLLVSCEDAAQARRDGYAQGHAAGFVEGQDAGYRKGHEDGMKEGLEKGYANGFAEGHSTGTRHGRTVQLQEDWNTVYAGNHTTRAVWLQWVEAVIVSLAALLGLGLLAWQVVRLVIDSATPAQLAIKAALAAGGGVCAFWAADQMSLFSLGVAPLGLVSFFLAPAPTFVLWQVGWIFLGFFPCLVALWYSGIFLSTPRNYAARAGIHAAIFTVFFTILLPAFFSCFNTPDIARFRIFDLALGFIGASVFYALWPVLQTTPHRR